MNVVIDGVEYIPTNASDLLTVRGVGELEVAGEKRSFIQLDKVPVSDYGRLLVKTGTKIKILIVPEGQP